MKSWFVSAVSTLALVFVAALSAQAQATRTWVSGVGDDANPCSRTAPCKTFAGAISKTAPAGEINVLDPGGFGAVTITKSITISSEGFEAGVLVSGTNGIIVNVPNATDQVVLRGLDIEGLGTGISGITVLTGGTVMVEKCTIDHFTVSGINFVTTVAGSELHVTDTIVRHNGTLPSSGQGILVQPSAAAKASLDNVRVENNIAGLKVFGSTFTSVSNSVAASNNFAGFSAASSPASLSIESSVSANNGTGVVCAASTLVRVGHSAISGNGAPTAGTCFSYQNNDVDAAASFSPLNQQ